MPIARHPATSVPCSALDVGCEVPAPALTSSGVPDMQLPSPAEITLAISGRTGPHANRYAKDAWVDVPPPSARPFADRPNIKLPPPIARPLSELSPLEHALAGADPGTVQSLLRQGADPSQVCQVRLGAAAASGANAAACARMIAVAVRMKRMNLDVPVSGTRADAAADSPQDPAMRQGAMARLAGRFAAAASSLKPTKRPGPITKSLQDHDIDAATKALGNKGSRPVFATWSRQRDQVIGMLALNETKYLEHLHQRQALGAVKFMAREPGVKSMLKEFSYLSNKPGRSRWRYNNGKVDFAGTKEKIVCRHLATYWLMDRPITADGKIDYCTLSDKKKLKNAIDPRDEAAFNYYVRSSPINLVENNRWGNFLKAQFQEMAHTGDVSKPKRILVTSQEHAMACELKIKQGADGHPVYTFNFYDPNTTASHRRVRTQDLARIETLTMAQLINAPRRMNEYYEEGETVSHAFVIPEEMPRPTPEQLFADSGYIYRERLVPLSALQRLDANGYTQIVRSEHESVPGIHPRWIDGSIFKPD
jgi:hypothetical protein